MARIVNEDQEALLQGIIENPRDDARRLIYADWLEEHDDETRAEFIRTQIAKTKAIDGTARHHELLNKCKNLFKSAGATERRRWLSPYGRWFNRKKNFLNTLTEEAFDRGFIEQIKFSFEQFTEHGHKLFTNKQPLTRINLWGGADLMQPFTETEALSNVRGFGLDGLLNTIEGYETFFSSPHLRQVEYLRLYNNGLNDNTVDSIINCEACNRLEVMSAWSNRVTDLGVGKICNAPFAETLYLLNLGGSRDITDDGVRRIARNSRFKNLRRLYLWETQITDEGFTELLTSKHFKLETLYLRSCNLGIGVAKALSSPQASDLRVIDLWADISRTDAKANFGDNGIFELVKSPYLKNLESITLSNRGITDAGADALIETENLPNLNWLALSGNKISTERFAALKEKYGTNAVT